MQLAGRENRKGKRTQAGRQAGTQHTSNGPLCRSDFSHAKRDKGCPGYGYGYTWARKDGQNPAKTCTLHTNFMPSNAPPPRIPSADVRRRPDFNLLCTAIKSTGLFKILQTYLSSSLPRPCTTYSPDQIVSLHETRVIFFLPPSGPP